MQKLPTKLIGPVLLAPVVHGDERGFFLESYRSNVLAGLGVLDAFIQDNHSRSRRGILRGMHFQPGQAKLVRCVRGAIFDVIVDIRPGSAQFGEWEGFRIDDTDHQQLYVPDGFAHGFCVLSELADERLPLPGADDYETIIPPTKRCMGRPIRGAGLVVCYNVIGTTVHVLAVKRAP